MAATSSCSLAINSLSNCLVCNCCSRLKQIISTWQMPQLSLSTACFQRASPLKSRHLHLHHLFYNEPAMTHDEPAQNRPVSPEYLQRFGGIARLYGQAALPLLNNAHFAVIGLGGVGTWVAEALARSGVGELTLIEMDEVCVTNTNRQSHALRSNLGRPKNQVITERLRDINPEIIIHSIEDFIDQDNMKNLIDQRHHVVIDAID